MCYKQQRGRERERESREKQRKTVCACLNNANLCSCVQYSTLKKVIGNHPSFTCINHCKVHTCTYSSSTHQIPDIHHFQSHIEFIDTRCIVWIVVKMHGEIIEYILPHLTGCLAIGFATQLNSVYVVMFFIFRKLCPLRIE